MIQASLFDIYPDAAGYKKAGTSQEAAKSIEPAAKLLRQRVLEVLRREPKTADEVAAYLGENILSIRPRLSELSKRGQIEETGDRRRNGSGKFAAVWKIK